MSTYLNFEVISIDDVPHASTYPPALPRHKRVVLVVDDERVIADTLSVILTRSGFAVATAYDGETAIELAASVNPDLLLSDVMMGPGMDGTQLAMQVVDAFPSCKVLLFSGHAATVDLLAKARQMGHHFTLMTKPVHPSDLLQRITESFMPVAGLYAN
ncbi:MAG TPA: response regulator [Acidobacteriaceae bacterium]|nr:response regulator [Acidobacteriaceae bacterium]